MQYPMYTAALSAVLAMTAVRSHEELLVDGLIVHFTRALGKAMFVSHLKHVLDVVLDIPAAAVDLSTIKAIFREKAWKELPDFMQMKERPVFECACQYFFLPPV